MTHRRIELRVPLPAGGLVPEGVSLAATLHLPQDPKPGAPVLFLFPGGGYSRGYFDLRPEGFQGYSQAEHHVAAGMIVLAVDHLGTGDSSLPEDEALTAPLGEGAAPRFRTEGPFSLEMIAAAGHAAVHAILGGLRDGDLHPEVAALRPGPAIGAGQSMGGHIVVITQANHATFDAVAALGSSFTQTRLSLQPGRRYPPRNAPVEVVIRAAQTETDWTAGFHWPEEPAELVAADMNPAARAAWRSRAAPRSATRLLEPGGVAREAAAVRCPVLLGYGEVDVTPEPLADVAAFRSSCDVSLFIAPRMAHMHNFAPTRQAMWRRLDAFVRWVAEPAV